MAKLNAASRRQVPSSDFAGPGRTYPDEDVNHARDALARASEEYHAGRLTYSEYERIQANAEAALQRYDVHGGSQRRATAKSAGRHPSVRAHLR